MNTGLRSRRAYRASFGLLVPPSPFRGRRECRVPSAPAASCAHGSGKCTRVFTASSPESPGIPRAMVYGFLRDLPGDRLVDTVTGEATSANLTPAPRRQDHTTSPSASSALVRSAIHVHRIPPRVRDDREPPLCWDGTAVNIEVIWVFGKSE